MLKPKSASEVKNSLTVAKTQQEEKQALGGF